MASVATVTSSPWHRAGKQYGRQTKLHSERVPSLPKYREILALEKRKIYDEKLNLIDNIDPYNVSNFLYSVSMELWPEIEFCDIANYLRFSTRLQRATQGL